MSVRDLSDKDAMELAMVENLDRDDLDVLEEADGYHSLLRLGFSVAEMATRFEKTREFINSRLELRKLGETEKEALRDRNITVQTAVVLSRLDEGVRPEALKRVVHPSHHAEPLSQRQAIEFLRREYVQPAEAEKEWVAMERKLASEHPGARVLSYADSREAVDVSSGFEPVDARPGFHDGVSPAWYQKMESLPTWGELATKYGGEVVLVAPETRGGDVIRMVEKQPLIDADVAQAKVGKHVFAKPQSESDAKEEKLAVEKARQEREARESRRTAQMKQLVLDLQGEVFQGAVCEAGSGGSASGENGFCEVYNLLHDTGLSCYEDDELAVVGKWVESVMRKQGNDGLIWLLTADAVMQSPAEDVRGWVKTAKLKAGDYPDLVFVEGEGIELTGQQNQDHEAYTIIPIPLP